MVSGDPGPSQLEAVVRGAAEQRARRNADVTSCHVGGGQASADREAVLLRVRGRGEGDVSGHLLELVLEAHALRVLLGVHADLREDAQVVETHDVLVHLREVERLADLHPQLALDHVPPGLLEADQVDGRDGAPLEGVQVRSRALDAVPELLDELPTRLVDPLGELGRPGVERTASRTVVDELASCGVSGLEDERPAREDRLGSHDQRDLVRGQPLDVDLQRTLRVGSVAQEQVRLLVRFGFPDA